MYANRSQQNQNDVIAKPSALMHKVSGKSRGFMLDKNDTGCHSSIVEHRRISRYCAMKSEKAVTAWSQNRKLLPFDFARQYFSP